MRNLKELITVIKQEYVRKLLMEIDSLSLDELKEIEKIFSDEIKIKENDKKN